MTARLYQFDDMMISESENYSIGLERATGKHFFSCQLSEDFVDVDAHFEISEEEFYRLLEDPDAGQAFARRCRAGEENARLFRGDGPGAA